MSRREKKREKRLSKRIKLYIQNGGISITRMPGYQYNGERTCLSEDLRYSFHNAFHGFPFYKDIPPYKEMEWEDEPLIPIWEKG